MLAVVEKSKTRSCTLRLFDFSTPRLLQDTSMRVATIAVHTFKESVRQKVLYNLVAFALLLIGVAILFGSISVGVEQIILITLGLTSISVFGLLMAIFIGIDLVSKEIERRTIYNVLSKPVSRVEFILGKYLGLLLTLLVNTAVMTAGFYGALSYQQRALRLIDLRFLGAVYFILLQLALVVGIAVVFSCISTPVLSAVYTFCLYIIGNFSADLRSFGQETQSALLGTVSDILYYSLPNFGDFNVISQVAHGEKIPDYLWLGNSLYALLYIAVLLGMAVLIFEEREFR
jgi:ABC-type transport system involved in multi-copper enzyme maturation permease subunit